jgi:hypothetical protein
MDQHFIFVGSHKGNDYYRQEGDRFLVFIPRPNPMNAMYSTEFENMDQVVNHNPLHTPYC